MCSRGIWGRMVGLDGRSLASLLHFWPGQPGETVMPFTEIGNLEGGAAQEEMWSSDLDMMSLKCCQ